MKTTVKYEIKRMYTNSTVYDVWHDDKEVSVPVREIDADKAKFFIENVLVPAGVKRYETSKAVVYWSHDDSRHITEYWYYK